MYFKGTLSTLQGVRSSVMSLKEAGALPGGAGSQASSGQASTVTPDTVAAALEIASRNNNSTMVNIAIRLAQLAQKNPQRAA